MSPAEAFWFILWMSEQGDGPVRPEPPIAHQLLMMLGIVVAGALILLVGHGLQSLVRWWDGRQHRRNLRLKRRIDRAFADDRRRRGR